MSCSSARLSPINDESTKCLPERKHSRTATHASRVPETDRSVEREVPVPQGDAERGVLQYENKR